MTSYAPNMICASCSWGRHAVSTLSAINLVLLDPDIRKVFRNERTVNETLRLVIELRKVVPPPA